VYRGVSHGIAWYPRVSQGIAEDRRGPPCITEDRRYPGGTHVSQGIPEYPSGCAACRRVSQSIPECCRVSPRMRRVSHRAARSKGASQRTALYRGGSRISPSPRAQTPPRVTLRVSRRRAQRGWLLPHRRCRCHPQASRRSRRECFVCAALVVARRPLACR